MIPVWPRINQFGNEKVSIEKGEEVEQKRLYVPFELRHLIKEESGSATLEFILLALPLFIPLAIFLVSINASSSIHFQARNFSRQLARAYVSSPDQVTAESRISEITRTFDDEIFTHEMVQMPPTIEIICSANPCLTAGAKVKVSVRLEIAGKGEAARASTIESVDQWRSQ